MARALLLAVSLALCAVGSAVAAPAQLTFVHDDRVWTIGADGSGRSVLPLPATVAGKKIAYGSAAWTPDGRSLAVTFSSGRAAVQFATVPAGGGALHVLRRARDEFGFALSPDGTRLIYVRQFEAKDAIITKLFVEGVDGSGRRMLARAEYSGHTFAFLGDVAWSPDGRQILYTVSSAVGEGYSSYTLRLVGADGSGDRLLAKDAAGGAWSPDGRQIAFSSERDENGSHTSGSDESDYDGEIYVMNADGSGARRLTDRVGDDIEPSWSADGSRLAFVSDANFPAAYDANLELWSVGLDGSCLTQLTNAAPASVGAAWRAGDAGSTGPACGSLPPPEADVALPAAPPGGPLWLGREFNGLLLDSVDRDETGTSFDYGDCAAPAPEGCPSALLVSTESICDRGAAERALAFVPPHVRRVRGAVVLEVGEQGSRNLVVLTGRRSVYVQDNGGPVDNRPLDAATIVGGLAPVGETPTGALAAPRLPAGYLRVLARTAAARHRAGSVRGAARRLHVGVEVVRERLLASAGLRRIGRVRPIAC